MKDHCKEVANVFPSQAQNLGGIAELSESQKVQLTIQLDDLMQIAHLEAGEALLTLEKTRSLITCFQEPKAKLKLMVMDCLPAVWDGRCSSSG